MKLIHKELINKDFLSTYFRYTTSSQLNEDNSANEPSQNAMDYLSTDFGFINTPTHICLGNNGEPLTWKDFVDFFVYQRKKVGSRVGKTGHYCLGGSTVLPARWGLQDKILTIIDGKYYMYKFCWIGLPETDKLVREDVYSITDLTVEQYELTKTEYISHIEQFDFFKEIPTFYFSIRKRMDAGMRWKPNSLIKNLNLCFVNSRDDFRYWIKDVEDSDKTTGKKLYFPTIKDGKLVSDVTELTQVNVDDKGNPAEPILLNGTQWDVFHYHYIDTKWTNKGHELKELTQSKEVWRPIGWTASTIGNHFFNQQKVYLSSDRLGSSSKGPLSGQEYNFSNMIWIARGDYPWPAIKSDVLSETDRIEFETFHKDYLDNNNLTIQGKHEDNKVDEFIKDMKNNKSLNYYKIHRSIQHITNNFYNIDDFEEGKYTLEPREDYNEREHDLNIFKLNEQVPFFHLEATETHDWNHVDKFGSYLFDDGIPYHVLEVDDKKLNQKKIKVLQKRLNKYKPIGVKRVYVILKTDFINFNKEKLKAGLIYQNEE